jgi:hypothetical protein
VARHCITGIVRRAKNSFQEDFLWENHVRAKWDGQKRPSEAKPTEIARIPKDLGRDRKKTKAASASAFIFMATEVSGATFMPTLRVDARYPCGITLLRT